MRWRNARRKVKINSASSRWTGRPGTTRRNSSDWARSATHSDRLERSPLFSSPQQGNPAQQPGLLGGMTPFLGMQGFLTS